jgi:serine/threonine-protein kinase
MTLAAGTKLGPFEVQSAIGSGGMGEVYRARDMKLNRDVALKILPEEFAVDAERLARFKREAQVLASLNHPNIAAIYGFEEFTGVHALVLELVEGPTLADRIAKGPVPLDEALPIARQVADALEAAHEHSIIHRDLKPANIKVRPDGTVKVLDFGLAKPLEPGPTSDPSQSPTITSPAMTGVGMILGTAAYMAPEQAKGLAADRRSDLWAFGCLLYEMLTGMRAFAAEDLSLTLAYVLTREPDWTRLPLETPTSIRRLSRRCLDKDRKRRLDSAAAARLEIDDALMSSTPDGPTTFAKPTPRVPLWRSVMPAVAVVIIGLAAVYGAWRLKPKAHREITRFTIDLAEGHRFTLGRRWVALSPDGTRLAYTANNRLYLRALDQLDAVQIAGDDGPALASPRGPFFSPDGQWVGYWHASQLKKVSVSGGAPVTVCAWSGRGGPPYGATWAADNTILLGSGATGIWRVSGNGGTPEPIITVDAGQQVSGPQLLPDGRTVLFTLAHTASWDEAQIVVQSLDNGTRRTLVTGGTDGRYLPTGHLVYSFRAKMLAVPFNPTSQSIRGAPVPVVEGVWRQGGALNFDAQFAVSSSGTLAYIPPPILTAVRRTLVWVDRHGREEAIAAEPRSYVNPRLAPDGSRLALEIQDDNQNRDIWVWDLRRRTLTPVTSDPTAEREPVWTPDGQRLIFSSWRTGVLSLFSQPANGTGTAELLCELNRQSSAIPTISPDGRHMVFRDADVQGSSDLMILDLREAHPGQPPSANTGGWRPLMQTSSEEYNAEISPDGRWLAYQSNSSGGYEVYVRPFPDVANGQWLVSTAGGTEPLWARDGRELFYRSSKGAVMRVSIAPESPWKAGTPTELFEAGSYALGGTGDFAAYSTRTYDVSPDGRRFLMIKNSDAPAQASTTRRIIVVQNWAEELKRLVPTK